MLCLLILDVFDDMHIWIPLLHVCKVDAKGVDEGMIEKNCFSVSLGVKYTRKMNITTQQWPERALQSDDEGRVPFKNNFIGSRKCFQICWKNRWAG